VPDLLLFLDYRDLFLDDIQALLMLVLQYGEPVIDDVKGAFHSHFMLSEFAKQCFLLVMDVDGAGGISDDRSTVPEQWGFGSSTAENGSEFELFGREVVHDGLSLGSLGWHAVK
jgi:hypothetical protein